MSYQQQGSAEEHLNRHVYRSLGAEVSNRALPRYQKYDPSQDRLKSNASFSDSYVPQGSLRPKRKKVSAAERAAKRKALSKAKAAAKATFAARGGGMVSRLLAPRMKLMRTPGTKEYSATHRSRRAKRAEKNKAKDEADAALKAMFKGQWEK